MSKKSDDEKKSVTKTIKVSPGALKKIEEEAGKKGMNFSAYMLDSALHRECSLTPEILCKLETIIEECLRIADRSCADNAEFIRMEADSLWESLK